MFHSRRIFAHFVHLLVLLAPSLCLYELLATNVLIFALTLLMAGILEDISQSPLTDDFNDETVDGKTGRFQVRDRVAMRVAQLTGILLLFVFWIAQLERAFRFDLNTNLNWSVTFLGLCLAVTGVLLRTIAIRTLGRQFQSDIVVRGPVIRRGIYRWINHPSEWGLVFIAVGGSFVLNSPFSAILAVGIFVPILFWRTRRENAAWSKLAIDSRSAS